MRTWSLTGLFPVFQTTQIPTTKFPVSFGRKVTGDRLEFYVAAGNTERFLGSWAEFTVKSSGWTPNVPKKGILQSCFLWSLSLN